MTETNEKNPTRVDRFFKKTYQQEVVWVDETRQLKLPKKPTHLFTIVPQDFGDQRDKKPELPIQVMSRGTVFIEDFGHDWNWYKLKKGGGVLRYFSRVCEGNTWVLLEYELTDLDKKE